MPGKTLQGNGLREGRASVETARVGGERKVLNGQGLAVRRESRWIVMRAVVQGRGNKDSFGAAGCGGRIGALASHAQSIATVNSIDK